MRRILSIVFLIISINSFTQRNVHVGIGGNGGYKSMFGEGGITINLLILKHFDLFGGIISAKFNGVGYAFGSNITFLLNKKWRPVISVSYNKFSGKKFFIGTEQEKSEYEVKAHSFIVPSIGLQTQIQFDDSSSKGYLYFKPYLSYRFNLLENKVLWVGGDYRLDREEIINKRIGSGFGIGMQLVYFFDL